MKTARRLAIIPSCISLALATVACAAPSEEPEWDLSGLDDGKSDWSGRDGRVPGSTGRGTVKLDVPELGREFGLDPGHTDVAFNQFVGSANATSFGATFVALGSGENCPGEGCMALIALIPVQASAGTIVDCKNDIWHGIKFKGPWELTTMHSYFRDPTLCSYRVDHPAAGVGSTVRVSQLNVSYRFYSNQDDEFRISDGEFEVEITSQDR